MNDRIKKLLQFLAEDENDPFTKYALAIEYTASDKEQAKYYFENLMAEHPDYIGTYYHAAQLYIDLYLPEKAKATFETGIAIATRNKETHALRELKAAYQNFLYEQ